MIRTCRFATLLLAALGLTLGAAHLLEMPQKMKYEGELYADVTSTLYLLFGVVGGAVQVGAVVAAAVLAFVLLRNPSFRLTLLGTLGLVLSLVLWGPIVAPVNAEWGRVIESGPASVPAAYARLRPRWEYGHVAAFAAWFAGFCLLLLSVVRETPAATAGPAQGTDDTRHAAD